MAKVKKCWLCLRITPQIVMKTAHSLWEPQTARLISKEASKIIEETYKKKPPLLCGKSGKGILSGLFYLLGIRHDAKKTQNEIYEALGCSPQLVKTSAHMWVFNIPELFKDFKLHNFRLGFQPSYSRRLQHKNLKGKGAYDDEKTVS